jgi:hypothetical protein
LVPTSNWFESSNGRYFYGVVGRYALVDHSVVYRSHCASGDRVGAGLAAMAQSRGKKRGPAGRVLANGLPDLGGRWSRLALAIVDTGCASARIRLIVREGLAAMTLEAVYTEVW